MSQENLDATADQPDDHGLARARELVNAAAHVLVFTGAGMSAECGIPTFRGAGGLWNRFRAEDLATPTAFARDPRLVWEWYGWRRGLVTSSRPGRAHAAVAERAARGGLTVVTQNVDGLHERSARDRGVPPHHTIALHGSLFRTRCTDCGNVEWDESTVDSSGEETLPRCELCGSLLRPDIVWFGEALDPELLERAFRSAREADVCIVVGTSARVEPAASIPRVTRAGGRAVIEINPESTSVSSRERLAFRGGAEDWLPRLLE